MNKTSSAFTIIELMIVIAIIGFGLSFAIPSFKDSTVWTKSKQTGINLEKINTALDYYKSEYGANKLPSGGNDKKHHVAVLSELKGFLVMDGIDPSVLKSKGTGKTFRFTEYGSHKLENKERYLAQKKPSFKWYIPGKTGQAEGTIPKVQEFPESNADKRDFKTPQNLVESLEQFIDKRQRKQAAIEKVVYFENPGPGQWIVPDGVQSVTIEAVGAGGSGEKAWIQSTWLAPQRIGSIHNRRGCGPCGSRYYTSGNIGSSAFSGPGRFKTAGASMPVNHSVKITFLKESKQIGERIIPGSELQSFSHDILETGIIQYNIHYNVPPGQRAGICNFSPITFEKYKQTITPNGGGGAGGYAQKTVTGLSGGEILFVNIGKGSLNSKGGETSVKLNNHTIMCEGGAKANGRNLGHGGDASGGKESRRGQNGDHGDKGGRGGRAYIKASSGLCYRGSGGNGDNSAGTPGAHGMVKITYRG